MVKLKKARQRVGRFWFRFPQGESGADVYDRVSAFLDSLHRWFLHNPPGSARGADNIVIVSHGLTLRAFLARHFHWPVVVFHCL